MTIFVGLDKLLAGVLDRVPSRHQLPILLYHHVGPPPREMPWTLTIEPRRFARQIEWLAQRGYRAISPSEWLAYLEVGAPLPEKPVLITFDDAYEDLCSYAFPILRERGFSAAAFIVTRRLGLTNDWESEFGGDLRLMTAEQIRRWESEGIEFGAHSRTHADLTRLPASALADEVAGSREDLALLLGSPPCAFAYPFGYFDAKAHQAVVSVFELAFTVNEGPNDRRRDRHLLRRTMVLGNDSLVDFALRIRLGWSPRDRIRRSAVRLRSAVFARGQQR